MNHLSRPNVRQHGVEIRGEAVVQGEHTLYLIVEADDEGRLREFMQPFQTAGSLDIYPASTCARVVASGAIADSQAEARRLAALALAELDGVTAPVDHDALREAVRMAVERSS